MKYYLLTASRDHIETGIQGGFIQQRQPHRLEKMRKDDKLVLYASKETFGATKQCRKLLGIATATDDECDRLSYKDMTESLGIKTEEEASAMCSSTLVYFRKKMQFQVLPEPADIRPLLPKLEFVKNKKSWGFYFMSGFREIAKEDYNIVCQHCSLTP